MYTSIFIMILDLQYKWGHGRFKYLRMIRITHNIRSLFRVLSLLYVQYIP